MSKHSKYSVRIRFKPSTSNSWGTIWNSLQNNLLLQNDFASWYRHDSSRRQESQRLSPPGWRNPGSEKGVITTQGQRAKPQPQICVTLSHAVSITYSWLVGWPTKLVCLEVWGFLGCRNLNFSFKLRISWENQDKLIIQLLRERQKWRLREVTLKTEQKKDPVLILGR